MKAWIKDIGMGLAVGLVLALAAVAGTTGLKAQEAGGAGAATPPASSEGVFRLAEVRRGMKATAWTVFTGSKPEPMEVEILGVLRGARGPGQDLILVQLRGAKPEYTGVVAGMSGSPVYVGRRLLGSLSYRIGQFSKDPIAGVTPIEQMLEVRELPVDEGQGTEGLGTEAAPMTMRAMETPLVMGGFRPEAIRLWQQKMAGTGLEQVMAGGSSSASAAAIPGPAPETQASEVLPGSAVSAQLIRGDLEVAATCTVTYIDPQQLLACGHPILQTGAVSLPMTTAEVVATLASPLNSFKIVNTGATIGAFTEDRESGIRGVLGAKARMIPLHIGVRGPGGARKVNVEVLDLPAITPQAVMVALYEALLESNESSEETSYHLRGTIDLEDYPPSPLDLWAPAGEGAGAQLQAAFETGARFARIYSSSGRRGALRGIRLEVEAIPRRVGVELEGARLVSGNAAHAGETVVVEARLRPWRQAARNVRIPITLPARLGSGSVRLLVSDSNTLDRTMDQQRFSNRAPDMETVLAEARGVHPADRVYVSLLMPETQVGMEGQTLTSVPLSVANALETQRAAQDVTLNGESAQVGAEAPAGGVLAGFAVLNLRIEPGGGLN